MTGFWSVRESFVPVSGRQNIQIFLFLFKKIGSPLVSKCRQNMLIVQKNPIRVLKPLLLTLSWPHQLLAWGLLKVRDSHPRARPRWGSNKPVRGQPWLPAGAPTTRPLPLLAGRGENKMKNSSLKVNTGKSLTCYCQAKHAQLWQWIQSIFP